ncbi:MAG: hypothetical protein GTO40_08500 [Deltaproteobacteria bacterium]|nr:hypothetical protein [Deltaproteobacteria bacterium]
MIVERFTWKAKIGCRDEVVKLVKALAEEDGMTPRVCTYTYGSVSLVTSDFEFETEEDRIKYWKDFDWSAPAFTEWEKKYPNLIESYAGNHRELLQVH